MAQPIHNNHNNDGQETFPLHHQVTEHATPYYDWPMQQIYAPAQISMQQPQQQQSQHQSQQLGEPFWPSPDPPIVLVESGLESHQGPGSAASHSLDIFPTINDGSDHTENRYEEPGMSTTSFPAQQFLSPPNNMSLASTSTHGQSPYRPHSYSRNSFVSLASAHSESPIFQHSRSNSPTSISSYSQSVQQYPLSVSLGPGGTNSYTEIGDRLSTSSENPCSVPSTRLTRQHHAATIRQPSIPYIPRSSEADSLYPHPNHSPADFVSPKSEFMPEVDMFRVEGPAYAHTRKRKARVANVDRKAICMYSTMHSGVTQEAMAARYGVERSTISKIVKERDRWLSTNEEEGSQTIVRHRPSKFPTLEKQMKPWLVKMTKCNRTITDKSIRTKAREIAESLRIDPKQFKASSGWIDNFKRRHNIRKGVYHESEGERKDDDHPMGSSSSRRRVDGGERYDPITPRARDGFRINTDEEVNPAYVALPRSDGRTLSSGGGECGSRPSSSGMMHRGSGDEEGGMMLGSPMSSSRSHTGDMQHPPQEAFATIFSWIASQGPGFTSAEEHRVLNSLSRRVEEASGDNSPY